MEQVLKVKAFLDTNILLDILVQGRNDALSSAVILDSAMLKKVELFTCIQSYLDISYILRKANGQKKLFSLLEWMLNHTNVEYPDRFDIWEAMESGGKDFEDEVLIAHANSSACDYFITSDRELLQKEIPGMRFLTPESFVSLMQE